MSILYNIGVRLYYFVILLASFLGNKKASLWIKGRKSVFKQLNEAQLIQKKSIWIHCASVGEFEQARPLIESIKNKKTDESIVLSVYSPSVFELRKDYELVDLVIYLPLDTKSNANKLIAAIKPKAVIIVKYEFWFNLLSALKKNSIPTYLISGIFRPSQHFFRYYGAWFRSKLSSFQHFFIQNHASAQLLQSIGITNYTVTGDTRLDRVAKIADEEFADNRLISFCRDEKVIVFGSAWEKEIEFALKLFKSQTPIKIIIAPHEINQQKLNALVQELNGQGILWTNSNETQNLTEQQVLIMDCVGLLSKIYRYADFAFIGGGFKSGIHNINEAAVYGCMIYFGPNFNRFQEAHDLMNRNGAISVLEFDDFSHSLNDLLKDPSNLDHIKTENSNYIFENKGATDKIFSHIFDN